MTDGDRPRERRDCCDRRRPATSSDRPLGAPALAPAAWRRCHGCCAATPRWPRCSAPPTRPSPCPRRPRPWSRRALAAFTSGRPLLVVTADRPRRRTAGRRPDLPAGAEQAGPRIRRRPGRGRPDGTGRRAPGLGDAALRAGQPRDRDHGAPARLAAGADARRTTRPSPAAAGVVAPVRALLQRLGPLDGAAPVVVRPGQQVDVDELLARLVGMGYRREHQVEHRGSSRCAAASSTSSPPPPTSPVRIDLWGDEVDRLTAFSVSDQRSSHDLTRGGTLRLPRAGRSTPDAAPGGGRPW